MGRTIRIGTRGSPLALAQATLTEAALRAAEPGLAVERVIIKTTGDRQSEQGTPEAGKGVFVKEIEEALLAGTIDVAVHSTKDLPTELAAGLVLAAMLPREDVRDAYCGGTPRILDELEHGARIGTGSPRRVAQLRRLYGHLAFVPVRGNVETRLRKAREGDLAGVVLARAGLARLGLLASVTELIPIEVCLPAAGQGAVGLEARAEDHATITLLARIHHAETGLAVRAERAMLLGLGGGCRTPIAAYGTVAGATLRLLGFVGEADGVKFVNGAVEGPAADPEGLGARLARQLMDAGADDLLQEI